MAGLDIAFVVAYVKALLWGQAQPGGGLQQWGGVGLGVRGRVATHHRLGAGEQRHGLRQRVGEAAVLVGDHSPGQAVVAQALDQVVHAMEDLGALRQTGFVVGEELFLEGRKIGVLWGHTEGAFQHSPGSSACHGAVVLQGQGGQAAVGAHFVCSSAQVGGAVDQGAVQIEQHSTDVGKHVLRRCGGWPAGSSRWCRR